VIDRWEEDAEIAADPIEPTNALQGLLRQHHDIAEEILGIRDLTLSLSRCGCCLRHLAKVVNRAHQAVGRQNECAMKYLVALAMLFAPSVSFAHSWYDLACCSGQDCKPVPKTDLKKHPDGRWEYLPLHQFFNPDQERPSGDANYHVCIGATRPEEFGGTTAPIYIPRCIYIPPIRSSMLW
jgi:hypothetical protein